MDNLDDVRGISFRRGTSIVRTKDRPLFDSEGCSDASRTLDEFPSPYLTGIIDGTEGSGILTARGCIHRCTYCNFSAMSRHTIRYHSIERVIAELKSIQNALALNEQKNDTKFVTNPKERPIVTIYDDAFTLNANRAKKICKRIIDENIKLRLSCLCRADNLDDELVGLLKQSGVEDISFGLESAVPRVLRNIKKVRATSSKNEQEEYEPEKRYLKQVKNAIYFAKKHEMKTSVSIILGLPGETLRDGCRTVKFVKDLEVDAYTHNELMLLTGTELFKTAKKYGIEFKHSPAVLPYVTTHTYPVSQVPYAPNPTIVDLCSPVVLTMLAALSGDMEIPAQTDSAIPLTILQSVSRGNIEQLVHWLAENISIGSTIILLSDEDELPTDIDKLFAAVMGGTAPVTQFHKFLLSTNNFLPAYIPQNWPLNRFNIRFPLVPIKTLTDIQGKTKYQTYHDLPVYCIKDKQDVRILIQLAATGSKNESQNSDSGPIWLDGVILSSCRFTKKQCPAIKLTRTIINEKGQIYPCLTGQPIGTIKDGVSKLHEHVEEIYANLRKVRKCSECPADNWCSHCLFPDPLSIETYCEIQKKDVDIASFINRASLASRLSIPVGLDLKNTNSLE